MPRRPQFNDYFRRPEAFLAELVQKYIRGELVEHGEGMPVLHRALVIAVDVVGGTLESPAPGNSDQVKHVLPNGQSFDVKAQVGPTNPKNSIKARLLTKGRDQFLADQNLRVFWPFFPEHVSIPIKPGEHVYVMFEDRDMQHGLWVGKMPGHEGLNFVQGQSTYKTDDDDKLASKFSDTNNAGGGDKPKFNTELEASQSGIKDGRLADKFGDTKGGG
jgi:hypothetical protein